MKPETDRVIRPALLKRALACTPHLALAALLIYAFGRLASVVWAGQAFAFDQPVMRTLHALASPWLTAGLRMVTASASWWAASGAVLALAFYYWRRAGQPAEALLLLATMAGSAALGEGLKRLFARPRPHLFPWLTTASGWSFPSGHTLTAIVLGGLMAWLLGRKLQSWRWGLLWAGAGLWTGLVGLSRVYLGVHYPSDALGSLAVGGLWLLAAFCCYRLAAPSSRSHHGDAEDTESQKS